MNRFNQFRESLKRYRHRIARATHRTLLPILGFTALIWFLVRVIPKPSRAAYPCQRAAFPVASTFVLWISGILGSYSVFRFLKNLLLTPKLYLSAAAIVTIAVLASSGMQWAGFDNYGAPIGIARGINPGRVVWAFDPDVTEWNGEDGHYWDSGSVDQDLLDGMLASALGTLTAAPSAGEAWDALFVHFNDQPGRSGKGYVPGEKIAVKINENNQNNPYAEENISIDALPQMVLSLLRQIVHQAGVDPADITVYDGVRPISDPVIALCASEFPDVSFMGGHGYPNSIDTEFPWTPEVIRYSGGGIVNTEARRIPLFLYESDYVVNLAILKAHNAITGVTLCGKNHFGSVGNPAALHGSASWLDGEEYSVQVDLMGHEEIGGKTLLYIIDGVFGSTGPRGYAAAPSRWESDPFGGDWPSSLFVSQDPVAIDSVGLDFLAAETSFSFRPDGYLLEAALAHEPPSGTVYDPEGDGTILDSLGVYEHWNNPEDKQYSRNLNRRWGKGIELIQIGSTG